MEQNIRNLIFKKLIKMNENREVGTLDLREEVFNLTEAADHALDFCLGRMYKLQNISNEIKRDFPNLSEQLNGHAEGMLISLEEVKNKLNTIKTQSFK